MSDDLKPCPFCGSDNTHVFPAQRGGYRFYPFIRCMECYLDLPGANDDYSLEGKTAIVAWNTRVGETP